MVDLGGHNSSAYNLKPSSADSTALPREAVCGYVFTEDRTILRGDRTRDSPRDGWTLPALWQFSRHIKGWRCVSSASFANRSNGELDLHAFM